MTTKMVCVLDMDCTLGFHNGQYFVVRPYSDLLLRVLVSMPQMQVILWSMGEDSYVRDQVNGYLPIVAAHAHKIYGRSTCKESLKMYDVQKSSQMIRNLYPRDVFVIGVDDKADTVMDEGYDVRISVPEFNGRDNKDAHLVRVLDVIFERIFDNDT